ncbi:ATP-binding protein [Nocardia jejuensis]|uniref:ATP-binding protein n=1 Tax=Nocardia jejuensis TaxID=328049 RepID=UPI00082E347F|nr:ATP-binding protein [Nocardia jejuensis]
MDDSGHGERVFDLEFRAVNEELQRVRHALRNWLRDIVTDEHHAYDILLAVGEACTNSVEHGHRGDGRNLRVRATADDVQVRITIVDGGTWRVHRSLPDTDRGRGLRLMRTLVPEVNIRTSGTGTVVELATPLSA